MKPLALVVSVVLCACAGSPSRSVTPQPSGASALAGRLYRVGDGAFVDESALLDALVPSRFVLLGEVHDSPDAHRAQVRILDALIARGRQPAVVFEMLDADRQPALDAARQSGASDPDALADAVSFDREGWPWAFYRPLFATALAHDLPIVAGNAPRSETRPLVMRGLASMDPTRAHALGLDVALSDAAQEVLRAEMRESHCNMLPESMIDGMALAQRARDGSLAERMVSTGREAVLVAGAGHARTDRGVPARLHALAPDSTVMSVGFVETEPGHDAPRQYAARFRTEVLPFDIVWFVPAVSRDHDQCEQLRHRAAASSSPPPASR